MPGWEVSGQEEQCPTTGKPHLQLMLKTPHIRWSAVKKVFPLAHIEPARNKKALAAYVHKEDTRVGEFKTEYTPNIFQYQTLIAERWDEHEFSRRRNDERYLKRYDYDAGAIALGYVDDLCAKEIEEGATGLEFIGINPMWRSSWKRFYASIIKRHARPPQPQVQEDDAPSPSGEETDISGPAQL